MYQLSLFDLLPVEVRELQYQWTKAIKNRIATEKFNEYELIDGLLEPVFLCPEYFMARASEMEIYSLLGDLAYKFKVFEGLENYLHM